MTAAGSPITTGYQLFPKMADKSDKMLSETTAAGGMEMLTSETMAGDGADMMLSGGNGG